MTVSDDVYECLRRISMEAAAVVVQGGKKSVPIGKRIADTARMALDQYGSSSPNEIGVACHAIRADARELLEVQYAVTRPYAKSILRELERIDEILLATPATPATHEIRTEAECPAPTPIGNHHKESIEMTKYTDEDRKMVQIDPGLQQSEHDLSDYADTWDGADVGLIPAVITNHFPELLDCDRFANSVPAEMRGIFWDLRSGSTQHGFQAMAVDKANQALIRHITYWEHEDVDHSTFSVIPLAEAKILRQKYCEPTTHKVHEIGLAGDYGPQAVDSPRGQERKMFKDMMKKHLDTCEAALVGAGYKIAERDQKVKPEFPGVHHFAGRNRKP